MQVIKYENGSIPVAELKVHDFIVFPYSTKYVSSISALGKSGELKVRMVRMKNVGSRNKDIVDLTRWSTNHGNNNKYFDIGRGSPVTLVQCGEDLFNSINDSVHALKKRVNAIPVKSSNPIECMIEAVRYETLGNYTALELCRFFKELNLDKIVINIVSSGLNISPKLGSEFWSCTTNNIGYTIGAYSIVQCILAGEDLSDIRRRYQQYVYSMQESNRLREVARGAWEVTYDKVA
jgi:hypothetical protein